MEVGVVTEYCVLRTAALDGRVWLRPNSDFHGRPSLEIGDPSAKVGCHVPFDRGCPSWVRAEPLGGLGNLVEVTSAFWW